MPNIERYDGEKELFILARVRLGRFPQEYARDKAKNRIFTGRKPFG